MRRNAKIKLREDLGELHADSPPPGFTKTNLGISVNREISGGAYRILRFISPDDPTWNGTKVAITA